ncbi:hypothetical protein F0562_025418 [Nyssa sinensis]|uniref:Uncharacterized protein n=1 Tax=Nyssa sinensis TaxID=561372 RepID=A0A5J5BE80_9ASTE|nr:hypothetical protein F0562_025418 [Nyssa sinensis]
MELSSTRSVMGIQIDAVDDIERLGSGIEFGYWQGNYTGCSGVEKGMVVIELGSSRYGAEPRWVKRSAAAPAVQDGLSLVRI